MQLCRVSLGRSWISRRECTTTNAEHEDRIIAITSHWTVSDHAIKTMLLAIREIKGEHMGHNISLPRFELAKKYFKSELWLWAQILVSVLSQL